MAVPVHQMDERGLRNVSLLNILTYQKIMQHLFQFKEFLEVYNKISEICFSHCAIGLNRRELSQEEADCCDRCTVKNYNVNHKILGAFIVEQPKITEQKYDRRRSLYKIVVLDYVRFSGWRTRPRRPRLPWPRWRRQRGRSPPARGNPSEGQKTFVM